MSLLAWPDVTDHRARRESSTPRRAGSRKTFASSASVLRAGPRTARCSTSVSPPWPAKLARNGGANESRRIDGNERERRRAPRRPGLASEGHHGDGASRSWMPGAIARSRCWPPGGSTRRGSCASPTRSARKPRRFAAQARALVVDTDAFAMERSIGRVVANAWTVDLKSGTRSDVISRIEDRYLQSSPGGRYLLYLKGDHYWTIDLQSGKQTNITATIATSFVDKESDATVTQKPAFGVAGWTADDATVLLYDKLDIWEVKTGRHRRDASDQRRRLARSAIATRASIPTKNGSIERKPIVVATFWFALEEIRLRAPRSGHALGSVRDVARLARQARRSTGKGEARRSVRLCRPGLRRLARLLRRRRRRWPTRGRSPRPIRSWPSTRGAAPTLVDYKSAQRAAAAGGAVLPGRLRAGAQVSDGRLHVREAVGRRALVLGAVRTRLLQRRGLHHARLRLPAARHRVPSARARAVGGRMRRSRGAARRADGPRRSRARSASSATRGAASTACISRRTPTPSPRPSPARRSPIWSATTATITGRAASPRPITSRPASSACRCRSTKICRPTSATRRSTRRTR